MEEGNFILIGATTENPKYSLNNALISRLNFIELKKIENNDLCNILKNIIIKQGYPNCPVEVLDLIADSADGDARRAINYLEIVYQKYLKDIVGSSDWDIKEIKDTILKNNRSYDRDQNRHYEVISAFIKSMRGSDPRSTLLWLAIMLDGGEDPLFIARRMIIFASEDIGLADPHALVIANEVFKACETIGYPECQINLAHGTVYLANADKDRSSYNAYFEALEDVKRLGNLSIPLNIRNAPTKLMKELGYGKDYEQYPVKGSSYLPDKLKGKRYIKSS